MKQATDEAMKWLREEAATGVMRQRMLEDPQQRSAVRKEMRVKLKTCKLRLALLRTTIRRSPEES